MENQEQKSNIDQPVVIRRAGKTKEILLGRDCDVVDVQVPIWYNKDEMISFLRHKNYCKEIAEELAQIWVDDLNGAFRKGFEKGFQYAKGENIDAIVTVR
jgi:hypothetical protein